MMNELLKSVLRSANLICFRFLSIIHTDMIVDIWLCLPAFRLRASCCRSLRSVASGMCPVPNCGCGASIVKALDSWDAWDDWEWELQGDIPKDPVVRTFDSWDARQVGAAGPQISWGRPGFLLFVGMVGVLLAATRCRS